MTNKLSNKELDESQPLCQEIWGVPVHENLTLPHLAMFDGRMATLEHLMVIGTQMTIISEVEPLK